MKIKILVLALISISFLLEAQTPFECKGQYYLSLTNLPNDNSFLYEVKISAEGNNVDFVNVGNGLGLVVNAMGYRSTDNFIYGLDPNTKELRRIGSEGTAVNLGVPRGIPMEPSYYAGDCTPDGRYLILIGLGVFNPPIVKIDLESPNYQCTVTRLRSTNIAIVDIAFDPFTGLLYGHDILSNRIVTVNIDDGRINANFRVQPQVDQLGALFFDSFGNLYGYGAFGNRTQNKFVSINKQTGVISLVAEGPESHGQDGCSCPYTMELQKTVYPEVTVPCTDVTYKFALSNGSGQLREGINLLDTFPQGIRPKSVLKNPFGGEVIITNNILEIRNMSITSGVDTIFVIAEVGDISPGVYYNQATLTGLPLNLGRTTISDYPGTYIEKDKTPLEIIPLDLSFIKDEYLACLGDNIELDISVFGLRYLWSDGSTSALRSLQSPSTQSVEISSYCYREQRQISIVALENTVDIPMPDQIIDLGETLEVFVNYSSFDPDAQLIWSFPNSNGFSCQNCSFSSLLPLNDGYITASVVDNYGCSVQDSIFVKVLKDYTMYYPNVISANRDGLNDNFTIFGNEKIANINTFQIFDRWGNLVHVGDNSMLNSPNQGWDGYLSGKVLSQGLYVWRAHIEFIDGHQVQLSGEILLLRQ